MLVVIGFLNMHLQVLKEKRVKFLTHLRRRWVFVHVLVIGGIQWQFAIRHRPCGIPGSVIDFSFYEEVKLDFF